MAMELITEFQKLIKRDFDLNAASVARLNPNNADAVEQGEFAALSTVAGEREVVALGALTGDLGTGGVTGATLPTNFPLVYQIFTERGRSDTQALDQLTVLYAGKYEAETNLFENTAAIAVGQPLTVRQGTKAEVANRLVLAPAVATDVVFAFALVALANTETALGTVNLVYRWEGPLFVAV